MVLCLPIPEKIHDVHFSISVDVLKYRMSCYCSTQIGPLYPVGQVIFLVIFFLSVSIFSNISWFPPPILNRRVLIFPKGNNVDYLSMYLDVADSTSLPYGWSRYAQFSLAVVNQIHNKYTIRKGNLFSLFLAILTRWTAMHDV